ncbi:hypothetical protein FQK04_08310 [Acinetobacter baumannii]|nr:hypothetical protein FJV00_05805 [Acinetobacter baumannii]TWO48394.1 hypothetical protein FQK04_08310 [Acinetobacter baumannii]
MSSIFVAVYFNPKASLTKSEFHSFITERCAFLKICLQSASVFHIVVLLIDIFLGDFPIFA